jgi:hypothetical protein
VRAWTRRRRRGRPTPRPLNPRPATASAREGAGLRRGGAIGGGPGGRPLPRQSGTPGSSVGDSGTRYLSQTLAHLGPAVGTGKRRVLPAQTEP